MSFSTASPANFTAEDSRHDNIFQKNQTKLLSGKKSDISESKFDEMSPSPNSYNTCEEFFPSTPSTPVSPKKPKRPTHKPSNNDIPENFKSTSSFKNISVHSFTDKRANRSSSSAIFNLYPPGSSFQFSYDASRRVSVATETIKRLEDEIAKLLASYYSISLTIAPQPNNVFTNIGASFGVNSSVSGIEEASRPNVVNKISSHRSSTFGNSFNGTRLAGIFTNPLQNQKVSQGYTKTLGQLKSLLSKYHRKANGYLPLRRQLLAFLFIPFATRPLNEANCRQVIAAVQELLTEFPLDSSTQICQLINWLIAALHVTSLPVKELILEQIQALLTQSTRRANLSLRAPFLIEMSASLIHFSGIIENDKPKFPSEELNLKVDKILQQILSSRDQLINNSNIEPNRQHLSQLLSLAYILVSSNPSVQSHTLKLLKELRWPDSQDPLSYDFYQTFINSVHAMMVTFISNTGFSHDPIVHQILQLVYKHYPASKRNLCCYDDMTWCLITRCALLGFGLGASIQNASVALHLDTRSQIIRSTRIYLQSCIQNNMGNLIISSIKSLIQEFDISIVVSIYNQMTLDCTDKVFAETLLNESLPILYNRFFYAPDLPIIEPLQNFFLELKSSFVQTVYQPLLSLIQTQDPEEASRLLAWIQFLIKTLSAPTLFFTEPDLICVVLFSSMGPQQSYALGQVVFLYQLILAIRNFRQDHSDQHQSNFNSMTKLLIDLEKQITLLLLARERLNQPELAPILKNIIILLLMEIRLFAQPRKRPSWINIVLSWIKSSNDIHLLQNDYSQIIEKLRIVDSIVYSQLKPPQSSLYLRRMSLPEVLSREHNEAIPFMVSNASFTKVTNDSFHHSSFNDFFPPPKDSPIFSLLASVYFYLTDNELDQALPFLWKYGLDSKSSGGNPYAQLLILLAGERPGILVEPFIQKQLKNASEPEPLTQLEILATIFGSRRSLLRHLKTVDPAEKPFKRAGPNLSFVSTMIGTFQLVLQESRWLEKLKHFGTSLDEIKMIQSLGWDAEDSDEDIESIEGASENWRSGNHPVTLSSSTFEEVFHAEYESDCQNDESTTTQRKKPLLTPVTGSIFIGLTRELSFRLDPQLSLRTDLLYTLIRDEPSWFLRLLLSPLEKCREESLERHLSDVNQLACLKAKLPLQFTYHTFNYLSGWLKWLYRDAQNSDLSSVAKVVPILARLLPSSHEITFRELCKAKLDVAFLCDARLVLPEPNSLFRITARQLDAQISSPHAAMILQVIPKPLFDLGLLRIGQSHFMTKLLMRSPHDVYQLAKSLSNFEPINWVFSSPGKGVNVIMPLTPSREKDHGQTLKLANPLTIYHITFRSFSSLHSHAWLGFLEQLFDCMGWNYQDRHGLELLLEGINRILLSHHNDFPLLARVTRLLVRVALQFRRIFNIKSGYTLFIDALFQVYFVTQDTISKAGIQFAVALFFNLHQESFVFQMLGSLVPLILDLAQHHPKRAGTMSKSLYEWFMCLEKRPESDPFSLLGSIPCQAHPMSLPEEGRLGIRRFLLNRTKLLHHEGSIKDFKHFTVADSLKLFVTIIGYDPGSLRSEQFVIMLQHLLPYLMKSISASDLVDYAVKSTIPVFVRFSKSPSIVSRVLRLDHSQPTEEDLSHPNVGAHYDKNWPQNDRIAIRIELFRLVGALLDLGGELSTQQYDDLLYILRNVIKANSPFSKKEGPLVVFINMILKRTRDSVLKVNIALKALKCLSSILTSCTRPFNVADILSGVSTLTQDFVGSSYGQLPTQFHTILPTFLKFGRQAFTSIDPPCLESSQIIGKSLVSLFTVMVQPFPQATIDELRLFSPNTICLSYFLVPLCFELIQNDMFVYSISLAQHDVKICAQKIWGILLGLVSTPLLRSGSNLTHPSPDDHPMAASLDFLLSLVGAKVIMMRVPRLLFQEIPLVACQATHILQTCVFDPLVNELCWSRNKIPFPVKSFGAWKLTSFWASTHDTTFLPVFLNYIKELKECKGVAPRVPNSSMSSNQNISVMAPSGLTSEGNINTTHTHDATPVLLVEGIEVDASKPPPNRLKSFRFNRGKSQIKPSITISIGDDKGIWSGISINHILTQLETQTFSIQSSPQFPGTNSSAYSSCRNSSAPSPSFDARPWDGILTTSDSHQNNSLTIPIFHAPASVSPAFSTSTDSLMSPNDFFNSSTSLEDLQDELKFILTTFGFPVPSFL